MSINLWGTLLGIWDPLTKNELIKKWTAPVHNKCIYIHHYLRRTWSSFFVQLFVKSAEIITIFVGQVPVFELFTRFDILAID